MINIKSKKTDIELAREELMALNSISSDTLEQLVMSAKTSYDLFWSANPEIKAEILGAEALKLFTVSAIIQQAIKQIKDTLGEEYEPLAIPENKTVTWNQDGSCKIE